jgi:hypothetical protein
VKKQKRTIVPFKKIDWLKLPFFVAGAYRKHEHLHKGSFVLYGKMFKKKVTKIPAQNGQGTFLIIVDLSTYKRFAAFAFTKH